MRERQMMREMTLEAVISIVEGISARMLRERLKSYLTGHAKKAAPAAQPEPVAVGQ
jgi:flagellar motor component MotA